MSGNTAPTVGDTDPTDNIDEDDKTANDPTTGTEVDESQDGDVAPSDESVSSEINVIPQWVWVFPIVGGAVLVGSLVVLILTSRKKKAK